MLKVDPSRQAAKFLKGLPPKQARQLARKITELRQDPQPPDSRLLHGKHASFRRADAGEYRLVYRVEGDTLYLFVVGKRNDDAVYRLLERRDPR